MAAGERARHALPGSEVVKRLIRRLAALVYRDRLDEELENEIRAHLELAERDARAAGLSPEDARLRARRAFGSLDHMKEVHRDSRSIRWIETLLYDVRYGLASLARDRAFTAIAVGVLALGIGANAAMFSVVDAVLIRQLPFSNPDRIVSIWEAPRPGVTNATSTLDFLDWKRLARSFEALAAEHSTSAALSGAGEPVRLRGKAVTADYFKVFPSRPVLGRTFAPREDEPVVVISHAVWQTQFGADPGILGRRPLLDGTPYEVIGVLPPERRDADFWTPLVFTPDQRRRDWHWLSVSGRLGGAVSISQARDEMAAIQAALKPVTPLFKRGWTIVIEPLEGMRAGNALRRSIVVSFGAVAIVLLIACANVTNLLLTRGLARAKEMAIRSALGAGRGRLIAQLFTETLMLCVLGGAAGLALASLLVRLAGPVLASSLPFAQMALDLRVVAFTTLIALTTALFVGILPSLRASTVARVSTALNRSGRGASGGYGRLRRAIVTAEVALSLVLVCGALLLFLTLFNLQRLDTGVRIDNVMTFSLALPASAYPTSDRSTAFYDALSERLESAPGISRAALATYLPLEWITNGEAVSVPGNDGLINVRFKRVDSGYFDAFDILVRSGRGIAPDDRAGSAPVLVVNEALAARLRDAAHVATPVGQIVRIQYADYSGTPTERTAEIVGIIRSERVNDPWRPDPPVVYVPLAQAPDRNLRVIVRTAADPAAAVPAIREAVHATDPRLAVADVATMTEVRDRTLTIVSRPAWAIGAFGAVAAFLAGLGLYGVLAQTVTSRRREIGIRMALGAQARTVVGRTLRDALVTIAIGLVVGLVATAAVTRTMRSMLFGVSPLEPSALATAAGLMVAIGGIAALLPALRAARVDPVMVLREE